MTKNAQTFIKIKCPHCGYEYVPAEIFMPGELIGKTKNVIRDPLGKILYVDYQEDEEPCLTASYTCDGCGRDFLIDAKLLVESREEEEELDFGNQVVRLVD